MLRSPNRCIWKTVISNSGIEVPGISKEMWIQALDFAYPYHQSSGFCLERSGYKDSEIALVSDFPLRRLHETW